MLDIASAREPNFMIGFVRYHFLIHDDRTIYPGNKGIEGDRNIDF